jgi:predicted phosphohydrolase
MAHSQMSGQSLQVGLGKDLGNQSHIFMQVHLPPVSGDNTGTFLSSMLERIETEIGEFCCVFMTVYSAYSAFMGWS